MFENQNAKTELMIVCDEKLMEYANYLMALIGQNDDVDGEVVGTKDGMVTAAIYTPKNYKDTLPKITSNTHILFVGSFKEAKEQGKNVDFKLDSFNAFMPHEISKKRYIITTFQETFCKSVLE